MLLPSKTKFRYSMRLTNKGLATRGYKIAYGDFALKSEDRGELTSRQIEAARKAIAHKTKRGGKLWIRVFPHKPISRKPAETRMGGGKSPVDHYAAMIKPGTIIMELGGLTEEMARDAFKRAADKLPVKTRFITWDNQL
ncbi:50S ribosomal protein L16 [candidate division WWE3 bacterium]|nr:50S ribosomal protein L16 [candidate division WWE3 bacterium]